jgi:AcrR family transcriptional regulator
VRQRDEEKERRILAGTLAVVERSGLAGLSMESVAKAAGVAIGTVYIYFQNKEALLNALYRETKLAFSRAVFEGPGIEEPVRPAFHRMCIAYMRWVQKNRGAVVFMHQFRNSPFLFEQTREETSRATEPLLDLLARGKKEGLLKDLPEPLMIAFLQGTLAELSSFAAAEGKKTQAGTYDQIARLAWDALKA